MPSEGQFCSTGDPERDALDIMVAKSIVDEQGDEVALDLARLTVPVGR